MSRVLTIWILYILTRVHAEWECGLKNAYCHQNNVDYRAIDGSCNNMAYPNWGTKFCIYDRLLPPRYGYNDSFPVSRNGNPLPNPRHISSTVFTEETRPDLEHTVSAIAYGQVVAHDLSQNYLTDYAGSCCTPFFGDLDYEKPGCASIPIPNNDPNYRRVNATCISLLRTQTNHDLQCSTYLPYSTQISGVTAYLDLSFIYGSTNEICQKLRTFKGGKLIVEERNDNEWLPDGGDQRQLFCPLVKDDQRCYLTGDPRVDQNPHLTIFHTIWAREHNRIAKELAIINPHWSDEKLFETARTIAIAEHQHITYYELLPCYGGRTNLFERGILYERDDFVNDYNKSMRPHAFNEFSHGAFRFFHSLTPGCLSLVDNSGCPFRSIVLRDHINRPHLLEKGDNFDSLVRGMTTQASLTADAFTDPEMTDYYFPTYFIVGYDVRAIDIHRSRDHGIASYNEMRYYCGYEKVQYFYQLLDVMDEESVDKLSSLYEHPDDIDLVVGGSLEKAVPGTLAGPTFLCIMYEQFYRTRTADRFFFENVYTGFTLDQLSEIRRSSIARLLCDNGNNIQKMQKHGFLQISGWNPRVSCYEIPGPNLKFWKEPYYDYDYDY